MPGKDFREGPGKERGGVEGERENMYINAGDCGKARVKH